MVRPEPSGPPLSGRYRADGADRRVASLRVRLRSARGRAAQPPRPAGRQSATTPYLFPARARRPGAFFCGGPHQGPTRCAAPAERAGRRVLAPGRMRRGALLVPCQRRGQGVNKTPRLFSHNNRGGASWPIPRAALAAWIPYPPAVRAPMSLSWYHACNNMSRWITLNSMRRQQLSMYSGAALRYTVYMGGCGL